MAVSNSVCGDGSVKGTAGGVDPSVVLCVLSNASK